MGIGLSGLVSGLDTDSLIKQLMSAERTRVTKVDNKITKNEWKVEKWKSLNSKIYSLYTGSLAKMKTQGNYLTKKTTSSNDKVVTVKAGANAPLGTHYVTVNKVASAQYVTGKALENSNLTTKSKLKDAGIAVGTKITMECGDKTKEFVVEENSTITDFVNAGKEAGLNINFDEGRQTFYISSRQSGTENAFKLTTSLRNEDYSTSQDKIKNMVDYASLSADDKTKFDAAYAVIDGTTSADLTRILGVADESTLNDADQKIKEAYKDLAGLVDKKTANTLATKEITDDAVARLKGAIASRGSVTVWGKELAQEKAELLDKEARRTAATAHENTTFEAVYGGVAELEGVTYADIKNIQKKVVDGTVLTGEEQTKLDAFNDTANNTAFTTALGTFDETEGTYSGDGYNAIYQDELESIAKREAGDFVNTEDARTAIQTRADEIYAAGSDSAFADQRALLRDELATVADNDAFDANSSALSAIGLSEITDSTAAGTDSTTGVTVTKASDAEVILNGATIVSSSNTITANGLTIEALSAKPGETVSVTVTQNTDSVYDMVKQFVKDYNEVLEEMNNAYYAESARGYEPLTDDQKDEMSDSEIEKWETKIKDSLLRRDNTLGSLITSMRSVLNEAVTVDGKNYSLASFGITTTKYTEKGKLHIYGDQDDSEGMTYDDKLRKAIEEDPEKVMEVLQTISKKLYDTMADKMKATNLSSALTFYNDKQLTTEMTAYKKEKKKEETRLQTIEDRYYTQFTNMEKALSNLSSQSNTLLQMLGQS